MLDSFLFITDIWSGGCVLAEVLLGQPIFPGDSGVDQLVEIIKVLGTPTREQIREMNPNYTEFKFPQIKAHPWAKVPVTCLVATDIHNCIPLVCLLVRVPSRVFCLMSKRNYQCCVTKPFPALILQSSN